jgi:hypothetical protein
MGVAGAEFDAGWFLLGLFDYPIEVGGEVFGVEESCFGVSAGGVEEQCLVLFEVQFGDVFVVDFDVFEDGEVIGGDG